MNVSGRKWLAGCVLAAASVPAVAQDIIPYLQGGITGIGGGVSIGLQGPFRARVDLYHGINGSVDQTESGIRYTGKYKYSESGLYLDWYPGASTFRVSGGLMFNRSRIGLEATPSSGATAEINGRVYSLSGSDTSSATVKFPSTMPYIGVGWGMRTGNKGWSLVADLGLAFGRAKTSLDASASLRQKITNAGLNADNELSGEQQQFQDSVGKLYAYPVARIGAGFSF